MNLRIGFGKVLIVICLGIFLLSCMPSMQKGEIWLNSQKDKPEINISGTWVSPEWGTATFKQEGREVIGVLGDYPAKGVVSGSSVYLLMYWNNSVDYHAELKAVNKDVIEGNYTKWLSMEEVKKMDPNLLRPMSLKRLSSSP